MDENKIWVRQSPFNVVGGSTISFSIYYEGATSVSSPSVKVYSKGEDVSALIIPSGSASASGNIVSMQPVIIPSAPNKVYVCAITATVDGNVEVRKLKLKCSNPQDE